MDWRCWSLGAVGAASSELYRSGSGSLRRGSWWDFYHGKSIFFWHLKLFKTSRPGRIAGHYFSTGIMEVYIQVSSQVSRRYLFEAVLIAWKDDHFAQHSEPLYHSFYRSSLIRGQSLQKNFQVRISCWPVHPYRAMLGQHTIAEGHVQQLLHHHIHPLHDPKPCSILLFRQLWRWTLIDWRHCWVFGQAVHKAR